MHEIPKRIVPKTKNRVFNAPVGAGILRVLHSYPAYSNNLMTSSQGSVGDRSKPWGHISMTSKCSNLMTGDQELLVVNGLSGRDPKFEVGMGQYKGFPGASVSVLNSSVIKRKQGSLQ